MGKDMQYQRLRPAPGLRDIVESIWVQHQDKPPEHRTVSWVVPTGTVEILFQYGDPVAHLESQGLKTMPRSYVTGQRISPVQVIGTGTTAIILVSLYPWGLSTLFPGGVEATDGYVDLNLLDHTGSVSRLEEQLDLAKSCIQRVRLVESFLLKCRRPRIDRRMASAAEILASGDLQNPLRHATRTLGVSERHFLRMFKSTIGLRPSVFVRIMRFQKVMRMHRQSGLSWVDIAAECGFSDQSHLIHEIQCFTGRSPGQISLGSHAGDATFNGEGASEFFDTVYM